MTVPVNALKRVWNYRTPEDKRDPLGCGESSFSASLIKLDGGILPGDDIPIGVYWLRVSTTECGCFVSFIRLCARVLPPLHRWPYIKTAQYPSSVTFSFSIVCRYRSIRRHSYLRRGFRGFIYRPTRSFSLPMYCPALSSLFLTCLWLLPPLMILMTAKL